MRTPDEWQKEYTWLSPRVFAERVGIVDDEGNPSAGLVRRMIRTGTSSALRPPLVKDVSRSSRPRYKIHPDAVERFNAESARRVEALAG